PAGCPRPGTRSCCGSTRRASPSCRRQGALKLSRVYRRAYSLLIGTAAVMGAFAVYISIKYDRPLLDPEGSFLGPSYVRLPLLLIFALAIDLIPRTMWMSRGR